MKVYLLYYDTDHGDREEWNIFYTPCEVFATDAERQSRIDVIKSQSEEYTDDDCFHKVDKDVMTPEKAKEWTE